MPDLLPLFLNVAGRAVVLVGGGRVAAAKLQQLLAAGARVRVVAPQIDSAIVGDVPRVELCHHAFAPADLDAAWFVIAAATPDVNREVAAAAEARRLFVNAVDDPPNASAFLSGVVRRGGVTIAISTSGDAPALTALVREGVDALLPHDLAAWMDVAREERVAWRRHAVPMDERKPRLLRALNAFYETTTDEAASSSFDGLRMSDGPATAGDGPLMVSLSNHELATVPWLTGPEDSWL